MATFGQAVSDGVVVARRNLLKIRRVPDVLVFSTLSPIMFVLLFAYVFGSAITIPGVDYKEFLMAGIFAQTVIFGSTFTGTSLAEDLQKGLIDRFRSLPMARSAVLVGRTSADVGINLVTIAVMTVTGLLVGWRIHSGLLHALAGFALLIAFAYCVSWLMAVIGLSVRSPEVFNNATFIIIFPLTFIANTFVPTNNFPTVLRVIADWNPISSLVQAVRELFGNTSPQFPAPDVWPLQHPVLYTCLWMVAFLVVFVPLAIRRYESATTR
ncbi:ABC transporter permease [Nakamurella flavida]|uniref:Transport permease protein n=1 Tax=Nakamurella flavida TaxID=363630 RepID=A0A938YJJ2_9ACTN|nr:ABC transporter permease [Nakamurella flavida]MBM9477142.1 ABC transporter permease [Nakamurella flavida]MDP9780089.1 ABC transporter DrrB family efflux protein [Nakamurella flavida]